jgi:methionyl-tRNA formyltransferase
MRLAYLGTPEMAVPPMRALLDAGHEVVLVVTGADKRRGRGGAATPSPVKAAALELGLPVTHDVHDVMTVDAELGVVVAFGRIIKPDVLAVMPFVNLHFSLLPRWRGAAPVERALLAGDDVTGVCVMRLEEGLDTGGIYAVRQVPIGETTTAAELREELVTVGSELLVETLSQPLSTWVGEARPQHGEVTYASKFEPPDFEIDWAAPVIDIYRLIRLGTAWTSFRSRRLKILGADLVDGRIVPTMVQPEGKAPMPFDSWRHGSQPGPSELFGDL